jgi:hypothetical protein
MHIQHAMGLMKGRSTLDSLIVMDDGAESGHTAETKIYMTSHSDFRNCHKRRAKGHGTNRR